MSTALLFPGQGSQYIGMGTKWIEKYPYVREYFDRADTALGFSISKLCFEGPDTELVKTQYTQPAILTTSIAMFKILKREKMQPVDAECWFCADAVTHWMPLPKPPRS